MSDYIERRATKLRVRKHRALKVADAEAAQERQEHFNELVSKYGLDRAHLIEHLNLLTQIALHLLLYFEGKFHPVKYLFCHENGCVPVFINVTDENLTRYISTLYYPCDLPTGEDRSDWTKASGQLFLLPPFSSAFGYFVKLYEEKKHVTYEPPTSLPTLKSIVELGSTVESAPETTFHKLEDYFLARLAEWDEQDYANQQAGKEWGKHSLPLYPLGESHVEMQNVPSDVHG